MIKIKLNSLIFPYFISLYNSIHDFERSTALGIGAVKFSPTLLIVTGHSTIPYTTRSYTHEEEHCAAKSHSIPRLTTQNHERRSTIKSEGGRSREARLTPSFSPPFNHP